MFIIFLILIIAINIILYLNNNFIAKYFGIYDRPDKVRKFHSEDVPITGGIFVFVNIFFYILIQLFFLKNKYFLEKLTIK